jgi:hypothetical protein
MKLANATRYPAMLYRGVIEDRRMLGALFARVTYGITGGRLRIADEQSWKVSPPPWESEYGPMDSDEVFYRGGVDLFVFGSARAPGGKPAPRVDVTVEAGAAFTARVAAFGERRWEKKRRTIAASDPEPFTEMPLALDRAFGGKDVWDGLEMTHPDNPAGKGYYLEKDTALGKSLPNIEDPERLVERWDDRPEPAGTAATTQGFGPRVRRGVVFDEKGILRELRPCYFNAAFPAMVAPRLVAGDRVRVQGVREEGPVEFRIPEPPLRARITIGRAVYERGLAVDQVGIEPDRQRAFVAYRFPFRYTMIPEERRLCELLDA